MYLSDQGREYFAPVMKSYRDKVLPTVRVEQHIDICLHLIFDWNLFRVMFSVARSAKEESFAAIMAAYVINGESSLMSLEQRVATLIGISTVLQASNEKHIKSVAVLTVTYEAFGY